MKQEFNLIDEPWICVRTADCEIKEISLKEVFLNAHEYIELSGETKTQDFAVFRLMLAIMYTIFSRYDIQGNKIDFIELLEEDIDYPVNTWAEIWKSGKIPAKPIEYYFEEWHNRFWLFDEEYPFYQSNAVNGKGTMCSTAKMIGTLFESANKARLFSARTKEGRKLSYSEAARWLLHINCFDDIAAKPPPKEAWPAQLGLIVLKGQNLFETMMLNYCANADIYHESEGVPSWEQDQPISEINRKIPVPDNQIALLSLMSRRIYLCRENQAVIKYYVSGGDYFEETEVFEEQMTLWKREPGKKGTLAKFKPKLYDVSKKAWQEFASIAVLANVNKQNDDKFRKAGILEWICCLLAKNILDKNYLIKVDTAAVIYNDGQSASRPVIDNVSDNLTFHSELMLETGMEWRNRILFEIEKCEKVAKSVYILYQNLQKANGRRDKDHKTALSGEIDAKMQFYDRIDRPFRYWLAELDPEVHDIEAYSIKLEKEILKIALDFGRELTLQSGDNAIFGHYRKSEKESTSSAQALNQFEFIIRNILLAGEKHEQK